MNCFLNYIAVVFLCILMFGSLIAMIGIPYSKPKEEVENFRYIFMWLGCLILYFFAVIVADELIKNCLMR